MYKQYDSGTSEGPGKIGIFGRAQDNPCLTIVLKFEDSPFSRFDEINLSLHLDKLWKKNKICFSSRNGDSVVFKKKLY